MEYLTLKGIISVQKTLSGELSQDVLVLVGKSIAEEVIEARDGNECLLDKLNTFVEKIEGKQLSTNDYTNADKSKVGNLPLNTNSELNKKADNDNVYTKNEVDSKLSNKANKSDSLSGYGISDAYTKTEIDSKEANLNSEINKKVSKVEGKDLSDNNYTNEDKSKVDNTPTDTVGELNKKVDKTTFDETVSNLNAEMTDIKGLIEDAQNLVNEINGEVIL